MFAFFFKVFIDVVARRRRRQQADFALLCQLVGKAHSFGEVACLYRIFGRARLFHGAHNGNAGVGCADDIGNIGRFQRLFKITVMKPPVFAADNQRVDRFQRVHRAQHRVRNGRDTVVVKGNPAKCADLFHAVFDAFVIVHRLFTVFVGCTEMLCRRHGEQNVLPVVNAGEVLVLNFKRQGRVGGNADFFRVHR